MIQALLVRAPFGESHWDVAHRLKSCRVELSWFWADPPPLGAAVTFPEGCGLVLFCTGPGLPHVPGAEVERLEGVARSQRIPMLLVRGDARGIEARVCGWLGSGVASPIGEGALVPVLRMGLVAGGVPPLVASLCEALQRALVASRCTRVTITPVRVEVEDEAGVLVERDAAR